MAQTTRQAEPRSVTVPRITMSTLIDRLGHRNEEIRAQAFERIVALGSRAVPALTQRLRSDRRAQVRESVADALKEIRDIRAVNALVGSLNDRDESVRISAMDALASIVEANSEKKWDALLNPLLAALDDSSHIVRYLAIDTLREIGDVRAIDGLLRVEARDPHLRWRARRAIDHINSRTRRTPRRTKGYGGFYGNF